MSEDVPEYGKPAPDPDAQAAAAMYRLLGYMTGNAGSALNEALRAPSLERDRFSRAVIGRVIQDMKILRNWLRRPEI